MSKYESISWSVVGSKSCSQNKQEKCIPPNENSKYLYNWKKEYSVENFLLLTLFPNSSLYKGASFERDDNLPVSGMLVIESSEVYYGFRQSIQGNRYVTCATGLGFEWFASLTGFFSIFDLASKSWILLFCFGGGTGIFFVCCTANINRVADYIWYSMFSIVILLEQGFTVPKILRLPKCLAHINVLMPIYIGWIIVGVVLSNAYRGANIDKLIAPIPEKRFETFDQIVQNNFTVYVEFSGKYVITRKDVQNSLNENEDPVMSKYLVESSKKFYEEYLKY